MRIANLVHQFPKLSETFILSQLNGLIAHGHEVVICANSTSDEDLRQPAIARNNLMAHTRYAASESESGMGKITEALCALGALVMGDPALAMRALSTPNPYGRSMYLQRFCWAKTLAGVAAPDIIHAHFGTLQHAAMNLRTLYPASTRLIVSFRGRDITTFIKQYGPDLYTELFEVGDLFVPCCEALGERLREVGCPADRIRVVRDGFEVGMFTFNPRTWSPGQPLRLACVGRFAEKKGFDDAIRAMAILRETNDDISLDLIGEGPLLSEYEKLVAELKLEDHVNFCGPIAHDNLPEALAPCHIFLGPSRIASDGDQEGIPNTLKEAMAMGLPCVTTDHSGTKELITHRESGILVSENDPQSLAAGVIAMMDRHESWREFTESARATVAADFAEEPCNQRLIEVYEEALKLPSRI